MKKFLFLFIFLHAICFAQFGANLVPAGDSRTFTSGIGSWESTRSGTISAAGGLGILTPAVISYSGAKITPLLTIGQQYKLQLQARLQSGSGTQSLQSRSFGASNNVFLPTGTQQLFTLYVSTVAASTNYQFVHFSDLAPDGSVYEIDNLAAYQERDTLWVFSTGSDTDTDTTLTLKEAFDRGINDNGDGVFILQGGVTFDESVTIDTLGSKGAVCAKISSSDGTTVQITQVDFQGLTVTLENIIVCTALNADNVTGLASCDDADKAYKKYSKYPTYPRWK